MTTLELQDAINQLEQRCLDLIKGAEKEVRKLTEAEDTQLNELKKELEEKRSALAALQAELSKNQKPNENKKSMENFSIRQAILESVENRQLSEQTVTLKDTAMRSMQDAAIQATGQLQFPISMRGIDGTAGKGKELVFDEAAGFLFPITESSVLSKLGARYMTGLKGNMVFTSSDGVTTDWKPEGQESTDGSGNFSNVTMKPKRLCCQIPIA
ncbi:MAG: phage major capsid protein, partial [Bacteroidales bacterium]